MPPRRTRTRLSTNYVSGPTVYPLAPSAWGAADEIDVDHLVQALLFSDIARTVGTTYLEVQLEPDPMTRGWRVRAGEHVIGAIAAAVRSRFPAIERIHASGFVPRTIAGARFDSERGRCDVQVYLPPPEVCVPRNNAPAGAVVLGPGDMIAVDTSTGEFSAAELAARSPGQWLVGLTLIDDAVVITLDGRVLGTVSDTDNAQLSPLIDAPATYARAHIVDSMVGLDISVPTSAPSPVPALTVPAPEPEREWDAVTFPDGTWSVVVERDAAIDPEDVAEPAEHSRPVSSPPSNDFTPTTSFRASSAAYLTEVEKLRIRRQQQDTPRGGRHRK